MSAKILITGSSGFIGKILSKKISENYETYLIDKNKHSEEKNFFQIDLKDKKKLEEFFTNNKIDTIIHLASEIFDANEDIIYENNLVCATNLIELAKNFKIKQIIFTSTFSIYEKNYEELIKETEEPSTLNKYGVSKFDIENKLKQQKNIDITIFRVPIVIGKSRSHRIGILFELIRKGLPIFLIGNGSNKIQFVSVDELNLAIEKVIGLKGFNIFNIGCSESYSFKENLEFIIKKTNSTSKFYSLNKNFGLFILNILISLRLIDINSYHKSLLTKNILLNVSKIKQRINVESKVSSRELFYSTYEYYVQNLENTKNIKLGSDKYPDMKIFKLLNIFSKKK
ncbi:NAD-dependent epimerase/dehydratase family protein [Candidatus Pelagibacter sp.]|uniref:NAD-dependent epimerase/dehydratase family protein n=1 Tax=Candidatus Pelagibacter sp. TaxID=2024849 RepID=UPI003F832664